MNAIEFPEYWKISKQQQKYAMLASAFTAVLLLSQFLFLTMYYLRNLWLILGRKCFPVVIDEL